MLFHQGNELTLGQVVWRLCLRFVKLFLHIKLKYNMFKTLSNKIYLYEGRTRFYLKDRPCTIRFNVWNLIITSNNTKWVNFGKSWAHYLFSCEAEYFVLNSEIDVGFQINTVFSKLGGK